MSAYSFSRDRTKSAAALDDDDSDELADNDEEYAEEDVEAVVLSVVLLAEVDGADDDEDEDDDDKVSDDAGTTVTTGWETMAAGATVAAWTCCDDCTASGSGIGAAWAATSAESAESIVARAGVRAPLCGVSHIALVAVKLKIVCAEPGLRVGPSPFVLLLLQQEHAWRAMQWPRLEFRRLPASFRCFAK